jgi:hypothetical protein
MLQNIDKQELAKALCNRRACAQRMDLAEDMAERIINSTHPLLEYAIQAYIDGINSLDIPDFKFKDYSIRKIQKIRNSHSFFNAIELLSVYIDDQEKGEKEIHEPRLNLFHAPPDISLIKTELIPNLKKNSENA